MLCCVSLCVEISSEDFSDMSHDCCGLSQSATRVNGPDVSNVPTYSVVLYYVGMKKVSYPSGHV